MSGLDVVVSVGTDHHPFDRLVHAVVDWARARDDVGRFVVQHGSSAPSGWGEDHVRLDRREMLALYRSADVIVTQVGPGTIADVNSVGRRPIVMPRDPRHGEVVDDHQFAFGRHVDELRYAWVAETTEELAGLLDTAAADGRHTVLTVQPPDPAEARAAFTQVLTDVMGAPLRPLSLRRVWDMLPAGEPSGRAVRPG